MTISGRLDAAANTLTILKDGQTLVVATFGPMEPEERSLWARRLLQAQRMADLLLGLRVDVDNLITELIQDRGGGVTGLAKAEVDAPLLFQRKRELDTLAPKIGGAA